MIKVLEYMFNNKKFSNSVFGFFGTALRTGALLMQSLTGYIKVSPAEVLTLWKNRKSTQKHLLIILDCNFSENWINYLNANPDRSVSIQGSSGM